MIVTHIFVVLVVAFATVVANGQPYVHSNFGPPGFYGPVSFNPYYRFPYANYPRFIPPPLAGSHEAGRDRPPSNVRPLPEEDVPHNGPYKVVCYYNSQAVSRPQQGQFFANSINPFTCTHVIYAYAILDDVTFVIKSSNPERDIAYGGFRNATGLSLANPKLKVMISVGGSRQQGIKCSYMSRSSQLRARFIDSAIKFLLEHGFHGLDLDWEHPGLLKDEEGKCEDKENFVKLIKELRVAFAPHGLLISAAISPLKEVIDDGYNLPELSRSVDFFNVKTYDYREANGTKVDHHSPLERRPHDEWENVYHNIEFGIRYLTEEGAEPSKLVLGIPFFARTYTLLEEGHHDLGSDAKGPGLPGPITNEPGLVAYYELCIGLLNGDWTVQREEYGKVPYAYFKDQWIAFDDEDSIEHKLKFIREKKLGGAMIMSIDLDDFSGRCGVKWPLTRKIYSTLCQRSQQQSQDIQMQPVNDFRPQIQPEQKVDPGPLYMTIKMPFAPIHKQPVLEVRILKTMYTNVVCKADGFIRDPTDCSRFYRCSHGVLHQYMCPFGLQYNEITYSCDWEHYIKCQVEDLGDVPEGQPDETPPQSLTFDCQVDGIFPNLNDCERYVMCANGEPIQLQCSPGTAFSPKNKICDWKRNVNCKNQPGPIEPPGEIPELVPTTTTTTTTTEEIPDEITTTTTTKPHRWQTTTRIPPWQTTTTRNPWERPTTTTRPHWERPTTTTRPAWERPTTTTRPPWERPTTTTRPPWERPTTTTRPSWERPTPARRPSSTTTQDPWLTTSRATTTRRPQPTRSTARPTTTDAGSTGETIPPGLTDSFKVVCYFTNWAWYRPGIGKYLPEDVDTALCTHVIYAFTVLDGEQLTLKPHDPWADIDNHFFERVVALKKKNPQLKVIVGIGGWTDSLGPKYSRLANNPSSRRKFITHALEFINKYGFDGLDLDWEYPKCWQVDCNKGPESDKSAFAAWVRELRVAFDNNTPRLLLTAAVSPSKKVIDAGYDVASIAKDFDFINVMTYDYHGSWEKITGHVAPLYYYPGDEFENFNANFSLHYYMELGAPREKLIMGMPFYGQTWTLANSNERGLFATTYGPGEAGTYSRQAGMLGYYEICDKINKGGWTVVSDPLGRIGPFAFNGNQFVSFDDIATIKRKSQFVLKNKFGGAMLWALDFDDFRNTCCAGKNPLLKTINRILRNYPGEVEEQSAGSCNSQQPLPLSGDNKLIHTEINKICITSRCTF